MIGLNRVGEVLKQWRHATFGITMEAGDDELWVLREGKGTAARVQSVVDRVAEKGKRKRRGERAKLTDPLILLVHARGRAQTRNGHSPSSDKERT